MNSEPGIDDPAEIIPVTPCLGCGEPVARWLHCRDCRPSRTDAEDPRFEVVESDTPDAERAA